MGFVVFYDYNEQHRIVGAKVEDFLAPIYASEAKFVVAVLGPEYGEKRWTIFESERFKERFDQRQVIPIWARGAQPTAFDTTRDIGCLSFDPAADARDEARRIADVLARTYEDALAAEEPVQIELDLRAAGAA
jgi:hypothetical protein